MAKVNEVTITADKVYKRKLFVRIAKIIVLLLLAIVSITYFILYMINNGAGFTIRVDRDNQIQFIDKPSILLNHDYNNADIASLFEDVLKLGSVYYYEYLNFFEEQFIEESLINV